MEKPLPSDLNAERATLGSILLDRDAIIPVAPWMAAEYFYLEKHGWIYDALLACYNRRVPPDIVNVGDELRRRERLDSIGGPAYLIELANSVPTAVHIEFYGRIVERTALLRRLITAGGRIAAIGFDETDDLDQAIDRAEAELFAISQRRANEGFVHIGAVVDSFYDQITQMQERGGEVVGIRTGFHDLDKLTGGLQRSDLLILAARPATGKTSLALNLAYNIAREGGSVAIFSLEMSREQLVQRILATETGVDMQKIRTGQIRDSELTVLTEALGKLSSLYIYIDDSPSASINEVRSKCRRLQAESGVDFIIIDYLQLMQGTSRREGNRVQEISEISRGLKALAREVNVPVMALSQLSRAVESRTSHVPMLSDLRESGCITGDSLVYLPDTGTCERIDALLDQIGTNVLAFNPATWAFEPRPIINAFQTGVKPVFRLTTRLGHEIRATANHKFLTLAGWKRLDELTPGMHLATPRCLPGPTEATLSDAELALLGHMIGDGCAVARQPVHYTTNDPILAELVADLAVQVFGADVAPRISPERDWIQVYLAAGYALTHGVRNPVAAWLDQLGLFDRRSYEKFVPEAVFRQPSAQVAIFLRHLWATDECINCFETDHYPAVYYASSSYRLAADVQSLLLRLEIRASIACKPQGQKGRDQFHVIINSQSEILHFLDAVGGIGTRKTDHYQRIQDYFAEHGAERVRSDIIPASVWDRYIIPQLQNLQMSIGALTRTLGMKRYLDPSRPISRSRASRIAEAIGCTELAQLASSQVFWNTIRSITPEGEEPVYDLTVDGLHTFVVNNLTLHNSIEQDADIVMFIYREELYDPDTDKKGIAELHLAKHRNGPTGIVPLRFFRSTTRFANLESYRQVEGY